MNMKYDLFDLHCDTVTEGAARGLGLVNTELAISLDRRKEGRWTQVFAIFMPDTLRGEAAKTYFEDHLRFFNAQLERHADLAEQYCQKGDVQRITDQGKCCAILAVEGGSVLAGEAEQIERLAKAGVKLLTLTWNGENEIAGGIASEAGITDFGRKAVRELEKNQIYIDCSHLNDRSFYDIIENTTGPLIASHSNSRTLCGHRRNLTDEQFQLICERKGLVGLNFYCEFLNPTPQHACARDVVLHLEHFLSLGGEDCVCLGSDYDGALIPGDFDRIEKIEILAEEMQKAGYSEELIRKVFYENAFRFFEQKN